MRIEILAHEPKAGGGYYEVGQVYEFPDDVAARWIALGKAKAVPVIERKKKPEFKEGD